MKTTMNYQKNPKNKQQKNSKHKPGNVPSWAVQCPFSPSSYMDTGHYREGYQTVSSKSTFSTSLSPVAWCSANPANQRLKPSVEICSFVASPCQTTVLNGPHQQDGMCLTMQCARHEIPVSSQKKQRSICRGLSHSPSTSSGFTAGKLEGN